MAEGTVIDSLQIQIQADAVSAVKSFEALQKALEDLRSALHGGAGLSAVADEMGDLSDASSDAGEAAAGPLKDLIEALKELRELGSIDMHDSAESIRDTAEATERVGKNEKTSIVRLAAVAASLKGIGKTIAGLIDKSNKYVEDMNLFNVSLGVYATEAQAYAERVSDLMGIDPANWMRNQGVFQILAEGFGVASDRAYIMSKNLTQLGYDLSSFFNIAVEGQGGAMQKLQAAISGELEPIRRLGFDLSEARLKAVAFSLGIDQAFDSMTQAQKAQLRYYAILTQVTQAQGDMARTLDTPANQLRILKAQVEQAGRAIGNIFIPALNAILPYAIAAVNALRLVAEALAAVFGFKLPEVDYSGVTQATDAVDTLDNSLKSAGGSAKKLNELLADWDELNIIQSQSGGGGGGGAAALSAGDDWTFDLPEYDFLKGLTESRANKILEGMKPTLTWITDHAKELKTLIEGIGLAVVGIKLGKAFDLIHLGEAAEHLTKIKNVLLTILGSYLTISISFRFIRDFQDKDENGNTNWVALLASLGTSVGGSFLTENAAAKLFKGTKYAGLEKLVGASLLLITGGIDIAIGLGKIMDGEINERSLMTLLAGSALTALGGAKLATHLSKAIFRSETGLSRGKSALFGLGTVLTLTGSIGLFLSLDKLVEGEQDWKKSIGEVLGSFVSTVAGGTLMVKSLFGEKLGGVSTAQLTGAVATLVGGLGLAVYLDKEAAEIEPGTDLWAWIGEKAGSLVSSFGGGLGAGALIFKDAAGKIDWKKAAAVGSVVMAVSAGISLATYLAEDVDVNFTPEQLKAKMWGAILDVIKAGAGIGLSIALLGGPVSWAVGIGAGVALLLSAAAYFKFTADTAEVEAAQDMRVTWGTTGLTQEQVEAKVAGYFEFDVDARVKSLTFYADEATSLADSIVTESGKIPFHYNNLVLGINTEDSRTAIQNALIGENGEMGKGTVIGDMLALIKQNSIPLTTLFNADGVLDEGEEKALNNTNFLSDTLSSRLIYLGNIWGKYVSEGFAEDLKQGAMDALKEITEISAAYMRGQNRADFDIFLAGTDFANLDEQSAMSVLSTYQSEKEKLWKAYTQPVDDAYKAEMSIIEASEVVLSSMTEGTDEYNALRAEIDAAKERAAGYYADIRSGYQSQKAAYNAEVTQSDARILAELLLAYDDKNEAWFNEIGSRDLNGEENGFGTWEEFVEELRYEASGKNPNNLWDLDPKVQAWVGANAKDAFSTPEFQDEYVRLLTDYFLNKYDWAAKLKSEHDASAGVEIDIGIDNPAFSADLETAKSDFGTAVANMNQNNVVQLRIQPVLAGSSSFNSPLLKGKLGALPTNIIDLSSFRMRAGGGFPDRGEVFVAKEAGAELVGRIGRRTAVANDDQIEQGIAGGVREANSEQNELLRQQNQVLRAILAKTGHVSLEPTTALARTVKRAGEMLAAAEGA